MRDSWRDEGAIEAFDGSFKHVCGLEIGHCTAKMDKQNAKSQPLEIFYKPLLLSLYELPSGYSTHSKG